MDNTVALQVNPHSDDLVIKLANEALRVWEYAQRMHVNSLNTVKRATEDLNLIASIKKRLEDKRKEFVQPLNQHVKEINDKFKTITGPVIQADNLLRSAITDYNMEQQRLQEDARRAQVLIDEAKQIQDELTSKTGEIFEVLPDIKQPDAMPVHRVETGTGSMTTRMMPQWEVTNLAEVPIEYMIIDAVKVGKLVRAGMSQIPGIRIWYKESIAVRPVRLREDTIGEINNTPNSEGDYF